MKLKKRSIRSRIRGTRICGYGFGKKHKGKGSKGGVGMAGTGKKAGQKITLIHAKFPDYFGKKGFRSIKQIKNTEKIINLLEIEKYLDKLIKKGSAKKTAEGIELNLPNYKILGTGELKNKFIITARAVSAGAREKIEKAGGKISVELSLPNKSRAFEGIGNQKISSVEKKPREETEKSLLEKKPREETENNIPEKNQVKEAAKEEKETSKKKPAKKAGK